MGTSRSASSPRPRVILLTCIALVAFAGNSVLCRMALDGGTIDAAGFSLIRLASAAAANREQLGIRVDKDLVVEAKVLAARQRRRLNEVVEEALRDLLKKYREKRREQR